MNIIVKAKGYALHLIAPHTRLDCGGDQLSLLPVKCCQQQTISSGVGHIGGDSDDVGRGGLCRGIIVCKGRLHLYKANRIGNRGLCHPLVIIASDFR